MKNDTIIEKIKALMAKANDAGCSEHESIAFMDKALELLAKYNLDKNDLKEDKEEEINFNDYKVNLDLRWYANLAQQTALMYFCKVIRKKQYVDNKKTPNHYYTFYGKDHNRLMASNMFDYLMKSIHRLATNHSKEQASQYEFKKGCAVRLIHRIYLINQENTDKNKNVEKSGLPALYNKELALVDDYINNNQQIKNSNKGSIKANSHSFYAGKEAANSISFNIQITEKEISSFLLK